MKNQVFISTNEELREMISEVVGKQLERHIPKIIRRANRKEYLTTAEVKELTGMSYRVQKYHRDEGNLSSSQDGRKIIYRTVDVEKFLDDRRIG